MQRAQRAVAWAALLLLAGSCLAAAQEPVQAPGYNCPRSCKTPNCYCASHEIPGGLKAKDAPQFVVLTNDDAITVTTMPVILDITSKHKNPNNCEIPATWFVSMNYTDYHLVQEVYMKNHEIATHTLHHVADPDLFQIVGMKLWLNQTAHVPLEKIRGFRAPFLIHTKEQRDILQQNGFMYDSSIPEPFPTATSPDGETRLWPYTMDHGLPQRCDLGTGPCSVNESHPGLWEFPMWDIQDDKGTVLTNMDPQGDIYEAYKREFDRSYYGNKAPVGVYIHAAWLMDPSRADGMNRFIEYAMGHDNVWFATMSEVLDWIKDPVSAKEYAKQRKAKGCRAPTDMWFPSGKFCKSVSCVNGNWSDVACTCTCVAEFLDNQPGFCLDPETKACTVPKVWSNADRSFSCPDHAKRDKKEVEAALDEQKSANPSSANCGHELQDFVGLGMSGTQDNAQLYSQALQAVDGLCDTCASARNPDGNYFTVVLPTTTKVSKVQLRSGEEIKGAFLFVGDKSTNNGMDNKACAINVDLPSGQAVEVKCEAEGKYVTLATPRDLVLCDVFVTGEAMASNDDNKNEQQDSPSNNPSYSTGAGEYSGSSGSQSGGDGGNVPSAPSGDTPEDNPLLDQLLSTQEQGGGDFHTTSAEEPQPDRSRVGMDGVNPTPDPTHEQLKQQLMTTYEQEIAVINGNRG
ncbi:chitin [Chlorella sorokiniana]|uniref:Chitin n=1 Tax=Chlorella sorokiniana TaxID=3076 RepID=A0A2P6U5L8_CHLSO|nr:chitin [Chlorella sorokiniana]|eukprot:PRW61614.1 chitin [Chlorella sorokiniana]